MNNYRRLNIKVMNTRNAITTCERKADFCKSMFKVIKFIHFGLAAFMGCVAIKEFAVGTDGIFALQLLGCIGVSGIISKLADKSVQKYYDFKKGKLEDKLSRLNEQSRFLIQEQLKGKQNLYNQNQTYYYGKDKEMKLTLRK